MAEAPFGHESPAVNARAVLGVLAILAVVVVGAIVALHFVLDYGVMPQRTEIAGRGGRIPPRPRLQPDPPYDLAALRAQKHQLLSSYAWTDASHEFARIPIDRATMLYLRQHSASGTSSQPMPPTARATPAPKLPKHQPKTPTQEAP